MAYDADAVATEASEAADDRDVLTESAVPRKRNEIGNQGPDIVEAMGTLRMPSDLGFLPGSELRVQFFERLGRFGLKPGDLFADRGRTVSAFQRSQFRDLGLELRHGLFEIEIAAHRDPLRQVPAREWLAHLGHAIACTFLGNAGLKRLGRVQVDLAGGIIILHSR